MLILRGVAPQVFLDYGLNDPSWLVKKGELARKYNESRYKGCTMRKKDL